MKLSVITLTYNNLEYTKKFVESLYKSTTDFELIVVDNGSTDGTVDYIQSLDGVKLILNKENRGFSKGNNQGIEIAEGEYIGFLNNDIILPPGWFEGIEQVFKSEPLAAFVSPRHVNPHYDDTNEYNFIKYFQKQEFSTLYEKSFDECEFSCVVTTREIINKIGVFDENYSPAFFEDNDYKYRAIMSGYNTYVANTCCFYHFGSVTSVNHNENYERNREYYYSKYPFAEYLSISGIEKRLMQRKCRYFTRFPLKQFYNCYLIPRRIKNRLKKGLFNK